MLTTTYCSGITQYLFAGDQLRLTSAASADGRDSGAAKAALV